MSVIWQCVSHGRRLLQQARVGRVAQVVGKENEQLRPRHIHGRELTHHRHRHGCSGL